MGAKEVVRSTSAASTSQYSSIEPDLRGATTIRQQLALHRDDKACASCHATFDPPGFALEAYDVIGGRRSFYRATEGTKAPDVQQIFRAYLTPEGEFKNHIQLSRRVAGRFKRRTSGWSHVQLIEEYQALIADETPTLPRNVANQMVMYFTGAPVSYADRSAIDEIFQRAGGSNPTLHELIHQVIQSPLFLNK